MTILTDDQVRKFLVDNGWSHQIKVEGTHLHFVEPETNCIELKFPETPGKAVYHTWVASRLGVMSDERQFSGALLWITYSSIGSPGLVETGWKLVERMRQGYGENRSLQTASGHFFRSDQLVDLNAFLLPCFIFGWDAYLVPSHSNDFFVHVSHDEYWGVVCRTRRAYDASLAELTDLSPKQSAGMHRRFYRQPNA